jgi:hypothetical protein
MTWFFMPSSTYATGSPEDLNLLESLGSHPLGKAFGSGDLRQLFEVVRGHPIQSDQFRRVATASSGFVQAVGSLDGKQVTTG